MSAGNLPMTAIVASRNEAHLLPRCLAALDFCDELIVIDVDSSDDTVAVAEAAGARLIRHAFVPIADELRPEAIAAARHDWVMLRDPDEVVPGPLRVQLLERFPSLESDVGVILGPIQYFFAGRPLHGTAWGGIRTTRIAARRDLVDHPTTVHGKLSRKPGCRDVVIEYTGDNAIEHYWATGYRDVAAKHRRYLRLEGRARAGLGETTSARRLLTTPVAAFRDSYVRQRGYVDGPRGLALSAVWSMYRTGTQLALLRERRRA